MKFTRDRYQQGSLRRVPRSKGPDVWEFRFSTYEDGARKQRQLTLSTKKYPSEAAVKRKVEALLLKLNAGNAATAPGTNSGRSDPGVHPRRDAGAAEESAELSFADGPAHSAQLGREGAVRRPASCSRSLAQRIDLLS